MSSVARAISQLMLQAVSALIDAEGDNHKELMRNVVVTGGGSCLPGEM